jgi:hypothetical protein
VVVVMQGGSGYSEFEASDAAIRRWRGDPRHLRQMLRAALQDAQGTSSGRAGCGSGGAQRSSHGRGPGGCRQGAGGQMGLRDQNALQVHARGW